ncbi:hypothetical protein ACTFIR_001696 [Dictyostelium discoideum]
MPLSIQISPNKKIGVPFKKALTVKEFIKEIVKRANLSTNVEYKLEYQNAELFEEDTLEELNILDSSELVLIDPSININTTTTTTTTTTSTTTPPSIEPSTSVPNQASDNSGGENLISTQLNKLDLNNNNNNNNNNQQNDSLNLSEPIKKQVELYESEIKQLDVIVLDLSGSMKSAAFKGSRVPGEVEMSRIELAQTLFQTFTDKAVSLEVPVAVGLVTFGEIIELTFDLTRNFDSFSTELGEVVANQCKTRLFEAIQLAAETLVKFKESCDTAATGGLKLSSNPMLRVFCLTDGEDNSNFDPYPVYQFMKKHNIILDSIPIGLDGRERLSSFSQATGGSCFIADSSLEGVELFEREALLSLSARDNFKPFSLDIKTKLDFNKVSGTYQKTIERKVEPAFQNVQLKQTIDTSSAAESKFIGASRRVFKEYIKFKEEISSHGPYSQFTLFLDENNIVAWKIIMQGPQQSPYHKGLFALSVNFPDNYPMSAPKIRFLTKIYHCNINNDGNICLDILKDMWSPALTISKVMLSISNLLVTPNPHDPLDVVKAGVYRDDINNYNKNCEEWCERYAAFSIEDLKKIHALI